MTKRRTPLPGSRPTSAVSAGTAEPTSANGHASTNGPGRPRDDRVDELVLSAALDLLVEKGIAGTTMAAVARRAGVARATVYLRWPTHDALIAATARHAMRRPPFVLTGNLGMDLRSGTALAGEIFREPWFVAIFPELVRALLARPPAVRIEALAPNRPLFADEYAERAADQGFRSDVDRDLAFDLMLGLHVARLLSAGVGASPELATQAAEVILAGLRANEGRGESPA